LTGLFLKIFTYEKLKISLTYKNQKKDFENNYSLLLVSTLQKMPYGLKVFQKMKNIKDSATLIAYSGSKTKILKDFLKAFFSSKLENSREENFESMKIVSETPYDYSLDGEIYRAQSSTLNLCIGPSFHFLRI